MVEVLFPPQWLHFRREKEAEKEAKKIIWDLKLFKDVRAARIGTALDLLLLKEQEAIKAKTILHLKCHNEMAATAVKVRVLQAI